MFRLIAADLVRHRWGALAIALLIALATALGVVVTLEERPCALAAPGAAAFDLVVGAPGSETQLVLRRLFLQSAPLTQLPGSVLAALAADPRVAYAAPVGFGDFSDDRPLVGTTQPLVDGLGGVTEGHSFRRLGGRYHRCRRAPARSGELPSHAWEGGSPCGVHSAITYRIVGRLAPTALRGTGPSLVPSRRYGAPMHPAPTGLRAMAAKAHGPRARRREPRGRGPRAGGGEPRSAPELRNPARPLARRRGHRRGPRQREQNEAAGFDAPINRRR